MASKTSTYLICDRCDFQEVDDLRGSFYSWGLVKARAVKGPAVDRIGTDDVNADMCPGCLRELLRWWRSPPSQDKASTP